MAARSASIARSVARSGTALAARWGTGRRPASITRWATATVSAHGVFGRYVRYTAVPSTRSSDSGGSFAASRGVISTLNGSSSPCSAAAGCRS